MNFDIQFEVGKFNHKCMIIFIYAKYAKQLNSSPNFYELFDFSNRVEKCNQQLLLSKLLALLTNVNTVQEV